MKKLALIFIIFSCIVASCTSDEKMPVKANVQFAITMSAKTPAGGRIASDTIPEGAYIVISITTVSGTPVCTLSKTELVRFGNGYITAPIALLQGSYAFTDFMVLSKDNEVLYAAPKNGSPLASLVTNPLPFHFTVSNTDIVNVDVQVVSVTQQAPQDFGYASLGIDIVGSDFSLSLFTIDDGKPAFASGRLTIYYDDKLVHTQLLSPNVNTILFKGDMNDRYVLFVESDGHAVRRKEYVLRDLVAELAGKPLSFVLEPALTMTTIHHAVFDYNLPFTYSIGLVKDANSPFKLVVDWGDGTIENIEGTTNGAGFASQFVLHFYADSLVGKPSYVNITGDLTNITTFYFGNPIPLSVKTMNVDQLSKLQAFAWMVVTTKEDTPSLMDFFHNQDLMILNLENTNLEHFNASFSPLLYRLGIKGTNVPNDEVNGIITSLYDNALRRNPESESGIFEFNTLDALTPESIAKLQDLHNRGWQINPNP